MYKNRFLDCIKFLVFLLLFLPSCSYGSEEEEQPTIIPNLTDRSWLTGEPCRVPCWYGLEPGKSIKKEAISTVKKLNFINPESMIEQDAIDYSNSESEGFPVQKVLFDCKEPLKFSCIEMIFEKNILSGLYLFPNYEVTFQKAVEEIGSPDFFMDRRENPEGKGCYAILLWNEQRMELTYYEDWQGLRGKDLCDRIQEADNKMPTDLLVHHILIMDKTWMEELISEGNFMPWVDFNLISP